MNVGSRLETINQQLMSSTRLQRIIDTYNLYGSYKGRKTQEEIIELMRGDIKIDVIHNLQGVGAGGIGAFHLSYRYPSAPIVAQVTNQLASLFIEENLKVREQQAEGTAEFIDTRLEVVKKAIKQQEASVRAAKSKEDADFAAMDLRLLREHYATLFNKKLEADTATDLERRQKSERFTILDPAKVPEKPVQRFKIAGWGE